MPQRIRTIKPELSRHEVLFEAFLSTGLPLRFAFVMLLTCCDREGRFRWQPRVLKLDVLPYDDCDFELVLDALWRIGLIECYEHQSKLYGCIPTWHKHQRINQKEPASVLPPWTAEGAAAAQRRLLKQCLGLNIESTLSESGPFPAVTAPLEETPSTNVSYHPDLSCGSENLETLKPEPLSTAHSTFSEYLNPFKHQSMEASTVPLKIEPFLSDLGSSNVAAFCEEAFLEEGLKLTQVQPGIGQAHAGTCQAQLGTCLGCTGKGREEEQECPIRKTA